MKLLLPRRSRESRGADGKERASPRRFRNRDVLRKPHAGDEMLFL